MSSLLFNNTLCIICQKSSSDIKNNASLQSLDKIKQCAEERFKYNDNKYAVVMLRNVFKLDLTGILKRGVKYHKKCYSDFTNKTNIQRLKNKSERCQVADSTGESSRSTRQTVGSTPASTDCVLCNKQTKEVVHCVETKNVSDKLKHIFHYTEDNNLKHRLAFFAGSDDSLITIALEIKYHSSCLRQCERIADRLSNSDNSNEYKLKLQMAYSEITNIVKNTLYMTDIAFVDMNDVHTTFLNILSESNIEITNENYKPILKRIFIENIPNILFKKPKNPTSPEQIVLCETVDKIMAREISRPKQSSLNKIYDVARLLRQEIENMPDWKFNGSFNDFEDPPMLFNFFKALLLGPRNISKSNTSETAEGTTEQDDKCKFKSSSILCQHVIQAFTSRKQKKSMQYSRKETPLAVGLALELHKNFRSKLLIDTLQNLFLSIHYSKVLKIENSLYHAVSDRMTNLNLNVIIPHWVEKNSFTWFGIDNIDFLEATPNGMNTLHGTVIAIFQNASEGCEDEKPLLPGLKLDRQKDKVIASYEEPLLSTRIKPKVAASKFDPIAAPCDIEMNKKDICWIAASVLGSDKTTLGTWSAFNSLTSESPRKCNSSLLAPLIKFPPSNYSVLYQAITQAQSVNRLISGKQQLITVISFDMQLYEMAMKFWTSDERVRNEYLFRPGELHIMFWALAALGKYIEGSGLDQAWIECGMYNASTVSKILSGRQYYRALEAHLTTILAIFDIFMEQVLACRSEKQEFIDNAKLLFNIYSETHNSNTDHFKANVQNSCNTFAKLADYIKKMYDEKSGLKKFLANYIMQFQTILNFLRATREKNFSLHLESVNQLIKYFFAHNHTNYARLLPLYLSSITYTKFNNPEIWNELKNGNFCVSKSNIPFTSIGPDHAVEHENKVLKSVGGIVGITQKETALDRFFVIAPELSRLCVEFNQQFGITTAAETKQHHQLHSRHEQRLKRNLLALKNIISLHVPDMFTEDYDLTNMFTRKSMDPKTVNDVLRRDELGQKLFDEFTKNRLLEGTTSVWEPIKRSNISTFKNANVKTTISHNNRTLKVREERDLLHRLLLVSRSRSDIDLKECIGNFEFGTVPRSLFASDGTLLLASDKSKIMVRLEDLVEKANLMKDRYPVNCATNSFIIVDGMAVVQSINKSPEMKYCEDLAKAFVSKIIQEYRTYNNIHIVFDVYIETSLKTQMREKRNKGEDVYYHITDKTLIKNITLKEFLSSSKTKSELTAYLGRKILQHHIVSEPTIKIETIIVSHNNKTYCNSPNISGDILLDNNHEEADTLLVYYSLLVNKLYGSDIDLTVDSPDTDVLILLLYYHSDLPTNTKFFTGRGAKRRKIKIRDVVDSIGAVFSRALLGLHAFTGTDVTGKFFKKSKDFCFKVFLESGENDDILEAFQQLGLTQSPSKELIDTLAEFVCRIYKCKSFSSVTDVRWYLYSVKGQLGENLPPTYDALQQHILR